MYKGKFNLSTVLQSQYATFDCAPPIVLFQQLYARCSQKLVTGVTFVYNYDKFGDYIHVNMDCHCDEYISMLVCHSRRNTVNAVMSGRASLVPI